MRLTGILGILKADVSIHAPVWGATNNFPMLIPPTKFQSTHPCGVRRMPSAFNSPLVCFNPRTRVGCDQFAVQVSRFVRVSIHAPVWGATKHRRLFEQSLVSIHAPVWGATTPLHQQTPQSQFQSTHPCGVRHKNNLDSKKVNVSIHAPVWGATPTG